MGLPQALEIAIDAEAATIPAQMLTKAATELGRAYATACATPVLKSREARIAYLVARMPAIFDVNLSILAELARLCPGIEASSVLDLGCGPGTATLAAQQIFGPLQAATMVDNDPGWVELRARLIKGADPQLAAVSRFVNADLRRPDRLERHDLVIISYVLGEMDPDAANQLIGQAWALARRAVVIVEPGTPRGFRAIVAARDKLIDARGRIVAPCTHAHQCPLAGEKDWCHFDARIARTRRHQRTKAGALPFEIEKFSYVIGASGDAGASSEAARIIKHPMKKSGHVILDLCTFEAAVQRVIISKRDKELYRQARAARWGDIWPLPTRE
jgi:ribosomal protein RSM22 (predicted rRNA methylase)